MPMKTFVTVSRALPRLRLIMPAGLLSFFLMYPAHAEESLSVGQALIKQFACQSCHVIDKQGGMVGPNLNQVTIRRDREWLMKWLYEPSAIKPGTLMPKFEWNEGDREAVIEYLASLATPVDGDEIIARHGAGKKAGMALIQAYQCAACHKVADEPGRMLFPDLTTVKQRRDAGWEREWLKDPQAIKPGTLMPNFHLSEDEINAITAFLYD